MSSDAETEIIKDKLKPFEKWRDKFKGKKSKYPEIGRTYPLNCEHDIRPSTFKQL